MSMRKNLKIMLGNIKYASLSFVLAIFLILLFGQSGFWIHFFDIFPNIYIDWGMVFGTAVSPFSLLIFSAVVSILASLTISMTIYMYRYKGSQTLKQCTTCTTGLAASFLISGCPLCIPLILTVLGVGWGTWNSFYSVFGIPLQLLVIAMLAFSLNLTSKNMDRIIKRR